MNMRFLTKHFPIIYQALCWTVVVLGCFVSPYFFWGFVPCVTFLFFAFWNANRLGVIIGLLAVPLFVSAQSKVPVVSERRDTIYGVALLLDTVPENEYVKERLTTKVETAYCVTRYSALVDGMGETRPRINDLRYYRRSDCAEIPYTSIFAFKQQ